LLGLRDIRGCLLSRCVSLRAVTCIESHSHNNAVKVGIIANTGTRFVITNVSLCVTVHHTSGVYPPVSVRHLTVSGLSYVYVRT
jgi:hypothetical protein